MENNVLVLESITSTRGMEYFEGPVLNFISTLKLSHSKPNELRVGDTLPKKNHDVFFQEKEKLRKDWQEQQVYAYQKYTVQFLASEHMPPNGLLNHF